MSAPPSRPQTRLSVNVNKVALLRNQRDIGYPDPLEAARTVLEAGADGITIHPRPDERHIRLDDVRPLARLVQGFDGAEFNIEGNPFEPVWLDLVLEVRPHQATLVPDAPDARTSDQGWDFDRRGEELRPIVARLKEAGIRVSLFIDAEPDAAAGALACAADRVEIYTGPYAMAADGDRPRLRDRIALAVEQARAAGLGVNAGHDLNLDNLRPLIAATGPLNEVSIGHALTADALWHGWARTITLYREALLAGETV